MQRNSIVQGDCFDVMKNIKDKTFDVSFTSPPYNRVRNDTYAHFNDVNKNYGSMLIDLGNELLRLTKKDVIINIQQNMCNKKDVFNFVGTFCEKIKGVVIWEKSNPQPNTNYRKSDDTYSVTNAFEYFFVLNENPKEFRANENIKNIITTPVNSLRFNGHGAVMRLDVAEFMIRNFSKEGDFVFDPFMGKGTTAVACINNKRDFFGTEIIQDYKEQAEKRIKEIHPSLI